MRVNEIGIGNLMLRWRTKTARRDLVGRSLYDAIVAQAREPVLYREGKVPDTMEGRIEMIMLHTALVLERLKSEGNVGQRLGQIVMETFVAQVDDALRQVGIGDMGVPHRVKRAAAALGERCRDYQGALNDAGGGSEQEGDPLTAALLRHVYGAGVTDGARIPVRPLAAYVRVTARALASCPSEALLDGRIEIPPPQAADFAA